MLCDYYITGSSLVLSSGDLAHMSENSVSPNWSPHPVSGGVVSQVQPTARALATRGLTIAALVSAHALATLPALVAAPLAASGQTSQRVQRRLRGLLTSLGPSFLKGAQLLSTRRDLLPPEWCSALAQLYDHVPAMPRSSAEPALREAFGRRGVAVSRVDWDGVASGSIACVYRVELADGRVVAAKVRRPRTLERIQADFILLRWGAGWLERLPRFRRLPAASIVGQVGNAVARQADLTLEREALIALRTNLADLDYLRVPLPVPELCTDQVLVMEYFDDLRQLDPSQATPAEITEVVARVLRCVYRMLFLDGLVHCDMHPGNLYLDRGGRIVLLDAGFVVPLEPRVRSLFAQFFLAMARGDGMRCADIVEQSADGIRPDADLDAFREGIGQLVGASSGRRAADFSLARFAAQLFDLQRRCGLFAAPEFVFPLLALLVLEGRINELQADVDFQAAALPVLLQALRAGYVTG